jgi:hypothetical protein
MFEDDLVYYRRRAEAELEQAQRATKPQVARAHFDLAKAYLGRIASAAPENQSQHA